MTNEKITHMRDSAQKCLIKPKHFSVLRQTAFCVFREWKRGFCDLLRWKLSLLFILLEMKRDLLQFPLWSSPS